MIKSIFAMAMAGAALLAARPAHADIGTDTVQLLRLMYQDTRKDCGDATKPAFMCSGVTLRATTPSTAYAFYSVSPASVARGGISASYLRKDAKFEKMAFSMTSGFIFDTILDNPADHVDYKALCAFPIDGATDRRTTLAGCGDYVLDGNTGVAKEDYCDRMGITTAEQWIDRYYDSAGRTKPNVGHLCAFNVGATNPKAAQAFYENIRAQAVLATRKRKFNGGQFQENEIVLTPWKADAPRSPSILASFHIGEAGLAGARLSQIQWYQATKQALPAISIKLPSAATEDAAFSYNAADQAIYSLTETDKCDRYVQSARWVNRYDPGFKKNIYSLQVTPTACGRQIQSNQTNNFFNEMVAAYYLNPEWINNADNPSSNLAAMRRQLVCVMVIARNKTSWMLEPSRPNATQEKAVAAGCNPVSA